MTTTRPTGGVARTRIADLPASFWWLWLAVLVTWVGRFVVPFLTLFLTSAVGMSTAQAGGVISAYGAGVMVSALVGGVLADRLGRKRTLIGSQLASIVVLVVIPQFVHQAAVLAPLLMAYGLVNGAGQPSIATLVGDLVAPEHRRGAYSFNTWAVNLGYAIGPVLAGFLAHADYALLFYGQASVVAVASVIVLLLVHDPYGHGLRRPTKGAAGVGRPSVEDAPYATGEPPETELATTAQLRRPGLRAVLGDRVFLTFTATMFCYYCVYVQSTTTLPVVMADQGLSSREYGYMLTLNGLLLCALQVPSLRFLTTRPARSILVGFVLVTAIGMVVQSTADALWVYVVSVSLWTLGELGLHPTAQATAADLALTELRGRYQGTYALAFSGANMIAPVIGGLVLDRFGHQVVWLLCSAVCVAVGGLLALASRRRDHRVVEVTSINSRHNAVALPEPWPAAAGS